MPREKSPLNATQTLVELVRRSLGGVSDYRIAKTLGVTQTALIHWRSGASHMRDETAARAAQVAGLDPLEWLLRVAADRERGELTSATLADAVADIEALRAGRKPKRGGLLDTLTRGIREPAAALFAAILAGLALLGAPPPARAADITGRGYVIDRVIYYARRRRRFRARDLLGGAGGRWPAMVTR